MRRFRFPFCRCAAWIVAAALGAAALLSAQEPTPAASTASGVVQDIGWSEQTAYNSNAGGNNQRPLPTLEQDILGFISIGQSDEINGWSLKYRPLAQFYLQAPNLDGLSHSLRGAFHWMPSPRWKLSADGWGLYLRGFPALATGGVAAGSYRPQSSVFITNVREVDARGRMALDYLFSPRTIMEVFGSYQVRRFPHASFSSTGVTDLNALQSGVGLKLQVTPRTQWMLVGQYDNIGFGTTAHIAAESALLTWTHRFTHQASLRIYGGPEYSTLHETLPFMLAGLNFILRIHRNRTYPTVGAQFWEHRGIWTWQIGGQHQISNGGGIFPVPVVSDTLSYRLDHPLVNGWHSRLGVDYARMHTLDSGFLSAHVQALSFGLDLRHKISDHLALDLNGNYLLQRAGGFLHVPPAVNRTFAGLRLSYDWRGWPNSQ